MTVPTDTGPAPVTSLLPDASVLAAQLLADDRAADHRLTGALRFAAHREISEALSQLLHVDISEQLGEAWRRYDELVAAARETAAKPGLREVVELVDHTFTVQRAVRLMVRLDDELLREIPLQVNLRLDVTALVATVVSGRLVAISSGWCDVSAAVSSGDISVETRSVRVSLQADVPLGAGLPLLSSDDMVPKPRPSNG